MGTSEGRGARVPKHAAVGEVRGHSFAVCRSGHTRNLSLLDVDSFSRVHALQIEPKSDSSIGELDVPLKSPAPTRAVMTACQDERTQASIGMGDSLRVCRREVLTIGLKNRREINTAVPPYYLGTAARGLVLAIRRRKSGKRHAEAEHCRESLMHRQWQHGGGIVLRDCAWRR